MLDGFGKIFPNNTRAFIYPEVSTDSSVREFSSVTVPDHLCFLYHHLLENIFLVSKLVIKRYLKFIIVRFFKNYVLDVQICKINCLKTFC